MTDYKTLYEQQLQENKKLKEERDRFESDFHTIKEAYEGYQIEYDKLKEENKKLKEEISNKQDYIDKLECGKVVFECAECDELKEENNKLKEENKKLQEQLNESEEEEEKNKYYGDDWNWVYGRTTVNNVDEDIGVEWKDVVLCISGGGSNWENWIMRPKMNYIENKNGLHPQRGKVLVQSSCGDYVSFQEEDYIPVDGECICEYEIAVECC